MPKQTPLSATILMMHNEVPTPSSLESLVLTTASAYIKDESFAHRRVFMGLVDAYVEAVQQDVEEMDRPRPRYVAGQAAETAFRREAIRGYRCWMPEEPDDSEAYPWWPEWMKLHYDWPLALVEAIGFLYGFREAHTTKAACLAYAKSQGNEKTESP